MQGGTPGSQTFGVRIVNVDNGQTVCTNKTAADMNGDVEGFFNSLYQNGVKKIVIQGRLKNGSSWKNESEPVQISFEPIEAGTQANEAPPTLPAPQAPAFADVFSPGLHGANSGILNAQLAQTHHRIVDYDRLVRENIELKTENKEFKKEIDTLKYNALENRFDEKKAEAKNNLIEQFLQHGPALMGAAVAFKNGAAAAPIGLGTPPMSHLSEVKQAMIETVELNEDYLSEYLYAAASGIMGNEAFTTEFIALLNKHQLLNHA